MPWERHTPVVLMRVQSLRLCASALAGRAVEASPVPKSLPFSALSADLRASALNRAGGRTRSAGEQKVAL